MRHVGSGCRRSMQVQHAGAACRCSIQLQHAGAACRCSMQGLYAGAACKCRCSMQIQGQHACAVCRCMLLQFSLSSTHHVCGLLVKNGLIDSAECDSELGNWSDFDNITIEFRAIIPKYRIRYSIFDIRYTVLRISRFPKIHDFPRLRYTTREPSS